MALREFEHNKGEDCGGKDRMSDRNYANMVAEPGKGPCNDATRMREEQDAVWICPLTVGGVIQAEDNATGMRVPDTDTEDQVNEDAREDVPGTEDRVAGSSSQRNEDAKPKISHGPADAKKRA